MVLLSESGLIFGMSTSAQLAFLYFVFGWPERTCGYSVTKAFQADAKESIRIG